MNRADLIRLLDRYEERHSEERGTLERVRLLLAERERAFHREHPATKTERLRVRLSFVSVGIIGDADQVVRGDSVGRFEEVDIDLGRSRVKSQQQLR